MKVLISGYYGFGNVGDDSVLQAIVEGLRDYDPKIKITALSNSPKLTKELHGVEAIHRFSWARILARMIRADVFMSGGGTLLQNITSNRSFLYYIGLIWLAKLLRKRTVVFAQGFGPLQGKFYRTLARFTLNRVDLITLRDQDSFDQIRQIGVKKPKVYLSGDPAAILKIPRVEEGRKILSLEAIRTDRPLVGIAVRSVPKKEEEKLYRSLSETIDWLCKAYHFEPVFVLFHCPEDMMETSKVINHMQAKSNVVFRMCRPSEMLSLVSTFDLLLGMRLHSLIFAAMNSVPMLGLSYDPKVEAFMKTVGQPYLQVDDHIDPLKIKNAVEKILKDKQRIRSDLDERMKELHDQAALNFRLFSNQFRPRRRVKKTLIKQ